MKATRTQLAMIHIAKKELGLDDETYRQALQGLTGKRSAAEITFEQADKVLNWFGEHGWKRGAEQYAGHKARGKDKFEDLGDRPGMATPAQLRKIEVMWQEVAWGDPGKSLRQFLYKGWTCSDLRFLTFRQAWEVIEAVKAIKERRTGQGART